MTCPRCHQPLSDPPERFCIHCGAPLDGAQPPVEAGDSAPPLPEPGEGAPAPAAEPDVLLAIQGTPPSGPAPDAGSSGVPWERRSEVGFFTALVDTTLQVLSKPREFYRRMAPEGGLGGPLGYGVILGYVGLLATAVYDSIFEALVGRERVDLGLGPEFDRAIAMVEGGPGLLVQVLIGPFAVAVGLMITAALDHLGLKLVGGATREFESTFRVCAFARAASIVSLIPLCGPFAALVWTAVLSIIGLQVVHGTSLGKATTAVVLPFLVACCCCAGSLGALAALMASVAQ